MLKINLKDIKSPISLKTAVLTVSVTLAMVAAEAIAITNFNNADYVIKWQSPVVLRSPVYTTNREVETVVKAVVVEAKAATLPIAKTGKEFILSRPHGDILWGIYGKESTFGKNDSCKTQGKYNGFGYGQNTASWLCFATLEEVTERVEGWLVTNLPLFGGNVKQTLCYYNTGNKRLTSCEYATEVLLLADNK